MDKPSWKNRTYLVAKHVGIYCCKVTNLPVSHFAASAARWPIWADGLVESTASVNRFLLKIWKHGLNPNLDRKQWAASIASGVLLAVSFPPLEWSYAIWFALVPVLICTFSNDAKTNAKMGFLTGLVFYGLHLYWIYHVTIAGMLLLIVFLSFILSGTFFAISQIKSHSLFLLFSALLWSFVEFVRSIGPFTFAWGYLGHALYAWEPLLPITYWIGVPGLSFLVFFVNATVAMLVHPLYRTTIDRTACSREVSPTLTVLHFVVCAVMLIAIYVYGHVVIHAEPLHRDSLRAVLVQANIDHDADILTHDKLTTYLHYSEQALEQSPDLIIWPESAISVSINNWPVLIRRIQDFVDTNHVSVLFGTMIDERIEYGVYESYNTALQFDPGDEIDLEEAPVPLSAVQRYDKNQLVPFGEYVPLGHLFPISSIAPLIETAIDNAGVGLKNPGRELTVFEGPRHARYGVAICFESTLSRQNRRVCNQGVHFLTVITYDSWFRRSAGLKQHFIQSVFRAAENRCYVLRSANTGITGVISATGRIERTLPPHQPGILFFDIPLTPLSAKN
jgi:apolipoprotein N-acyltransferase